MSDTQSWVEIDQSRKPPHHWVAEALRLDLTDDEAVSLYVTLSRQGLVKEADGRLWARLY